jgi:hypothetical protein
VFRNAGLLLSTVQQLAQRTGLERLDTLQHAHNTLGFLLPWGLEDPQFEEKAAALQQHLPSAVDCLLALMRHSTADDPLTAVFGWLDQPLAEVSLLCNPVQELAAIVLADNATAAAAAALLAEPARVRALADVAVLVFHRHHHHMANHASWRSSANLAQQLLQVLQQVASAAAAAGRVPPWLTLLAEQLNAEQQVDDAAGPADVPAGVAAAAGPSASSRVLLMLQWLQPLETCRQGLLALVPHVPLLQRAAAALSIKPVPEPYLQDQQLASQQWAEQIGGKAGAELAATKCEHAAAWRELQCAIVGVAEQHANNRAAAAIQQHSAAAAKDGQQPAQEAIIAAVDQLAAALPRVVELEQLLLLAERAAAAAAAGGDAHDAAGPAPSLLEV